MVARISGAAWFSVQEALHRSSMSRCSATYLVLSVLRLLQTESLSRDDVVRLCLAVRFGGFTGHRI